MPYTARSLIDYARSLADLQNTQFIGYDDEINLINEAYRDVYSRYIESDGDYWTTEIVLTMSPAYDDPNNPNGYLIPLPTDFLKIRSLSYNYGGVWQPCQRFSLSQRDFAPSQPQYRIKNNTLWVIGGKNSYAKLKLDYYPVASAITAPDVPVPLADAETVYNYPQIGSHVYLPESSVYLYALGNVIKAQNLATGTTATLYTSTNAIDCLAYAGGYIYWRDAVANIIYRAPTDFVSALIPVSIKTGVANFTIQGVMIYYSTATETRRCGLTGGSDSLVVASQTDCYYPVGAGYVALVGGFVVVNGSSQGITGSALIVSGGYLYVLDVGIVTRFDLSMMLVGIVAENVLSIGSQADGAYLSIVGLDVVDAVSLAIDTELDYPTNEVNELLAYTSAIAYSRKQSDANKMALLKDRLAELWDRFLAVNRRDEYQAARINNDYQQQPGNW